MAQCIICGNQTALHVVDRPLCPNCDEQREKEIYAEQRFVPINEPGKTTASLTSHCP